MNGVGSLHFGNSSAVGAIKERRPKRIRSRVVVAKDFFGRI